MRKEREMSLCVAVLRGLDLESEHCIFEHFSGAVHLIPLRGAQCSVNGIQIAEATQLNQGIQLEGKSAFLIRFFQLG